MSKIYFKMVALLPISIGIIFFFDMLYVSYIFNAPVSRLPIYLACACLALGLMLTQTFKKSDFQKIGLLGALFFLIAINISISYIGVGSAVPETDFKGKFYGAFVVPAYFVLYGLVLTRNFKLMYSGFVFTVIMIAGGVFFLNYNNIVEYNIFAPKYYRFEDEYLFDMHYFSDFVLILSLIYVGQRKRGANFLFGAALVICFLLGSRTPVAIGIFSYFSVAMFFGIRKFDFFKRSNIFIAIGLVVFVVYIVSGNYDAEHSVFRRFSSFDKLIFDFEDRSEIFQRSLPYADGCLLLGCFPFENIFLGENGYYIHNWMSFLLSFGFIPFALFFFFVLISFRKILSSSDNIKKLLPVFLFLLLCILFSRSYVWPFWSLILTYIIFSKNEVIDEKSTRKTRPHHLPRPLPGSFPRPVDPQAASPGHSGAGPGAQL